MSAPLSRIDQFAELLSQGLTTAQIGRQMGMTRGAVQGLLRRLRASLGAQAV